MSNYYGHDPERQSPPGEDDSRIERLEVAFAFPVWMAPEDQRALVALVSMIVGRPANQPQGGVHWVAGYGSRPILSDVDRGLLGMKERPDQRRPADGDEPAWDDLTFQIETSARPQ